LSFRALSFRRNLSKLQRIPTEWQKNHKDSYGMTKKTNFILWVITTLRIPCAITRMRTTISDFEIL
jgi:hypothetical protein